MTGTGTAMTLRTKPGPGVHTDVPQRETCRPHLLRCPCARRPSAFSGSSQDPEPCTWQLECPRHNANVGHKGSRGTYDRLTQPHRDSRGGDSSRRWWWSLELRLKKEGQTFFNKRKQQPAAGGGPPHPRGQTQTGGGHTRGAWVGSGHVDPQHSLLLHHEAPSDSGTVSLRTDRLPGAGQLSGARGSDARRSGVSLRTRGLTGKAPPLGRPHPPVQHSGAQLGDLLLAGRAPRLNRRQRSRLRAPWDDVGRALP